MSRLDKDDGELAEAFRALDDASRRRLACGMVRTALAEQRPPLVLPQQAMQLLSKAGTATPAQLAELDRQAATSGGRLLVRTAVRGEDEPASGRPWALAPSELREFAAQGLTERSRALDGVFAHIIYRRG